MNTKSKLALIAALALAAPAMALPSLSAADQSLTRTETVKYKVSQATTAEGAAALYAQLQKAAVRVCSNDGVDILGGSADYEACVADALTAAVQRVSIPLVSILHLQAGKPSAVVAR